MLVPNRSVWTMIATSFFNSGSPVRSARLRSASMRRLPPRISRLTSSSSSLTSDGPTPAPARHIEWPGPVLIRPQRIRTIRSRGHPGARKRMRC